MEYPGRSRTDSIRIESCQSQSPTPVNGPANHTQWAYLQTIIVHLGYLSESEDAPNRPQKQSH